MANTYTSPTWVLKEVARFWTNYTKFSANVERSFDDKFKVAGAKVGYSVDARLPQRFRVTKGSGFSEQPINDQTVRVTLTDQAQVGTSYSTADATMVVEDVRKRHVMPAAEALANTVDSDGLSRMYSAVFNSVGTPGTTPATNLLFLQAGVKLTDLAVPDDGRVAILDPMAAATIANANLALFHPAQAITGSWRKGQVAGEWMGISSVYQSQNVAKHTTGTFTASTPLTNGAGQTGATLDCDGWASGATTLKRGDTFTIDGIFGVNPITFASTGRLQQFVVTADTADSSGAMATLPISPSIITSGPLQTVASAIVDGAAITVWAANPAGGTLATTVSPQSLVYHPDAFILAVADLTKDLPGAEVARVSSKTLNISLRYSRQWSSSDDKVRSRIECLYGWKEFRPDFACRVVG